MGVILKKVVCWKKKGGRKFICGWRTQKTNWGSVVLMCRGQQQTHTGLWLTATWVGRSLSVSLCSPTISPRAMKPPSYLKTPPLPNQEWRRHPTSLSICECLCIARLSLHSLPESIHLLPLYIFHLEEASWKESLLYCPILQPTSSITPNQGLPLHPSLLQIKTVLSFDCNLLSENRRSSKNKQRSDLWSSLLAYMT